jgi:hypothetical protein
MKARLCCFLVLMGMLITLLGIAIPAVTTDAAAGAQQIWYITDTLNLAPSPSLATGSTQISAPQPLRTDSNASAAMTIPAGHWRGYIALSSAYTGSANINIGSGQGELISYAGTCNLPQSTYQNGFSLDIEAGEMLIAEGDAIYLRFETGSPAILTGGSDCYIASPTGSPAFPDPGVNTTYGLTISASGNGTTMPAASATAYEYYAGTVVPIAATAAAGNHFSGWSGAFTGTTNPTTISMNGVKAITANFAADAPTTTATTSVVSSDNRTSAAGQAVTFTATVTPVSGTGIPTGTVTFFDGSGSLGNGTSSGSGRWTYTTASLSIGAHYITAEYGGNLLFEASVSGTLEFRVVAGYVDLILVSSTATVVVGDSFDVLIQARSGGQAVVGVDAYLDFDPTILAVVDMDNVTSGTQISGGTTLPEQIQNGADNISGHINYSAGALGGEGVTYPAGTFTVAAIRFRSLSTTAPNTAVTFANSGARKSYVSGDTSGTDVSGTLTGGIYIVLAGVNIEVSVGLQGTNRPNSAWNIPLTVKFFTPGVNVLSAIPLYSFTLTTERVNSIAVIQCTGIHPGNYDITAVSSHTLINLKRNAVIDINTSGVSMGTLLEGNAANDDRISIADFSILTGCYGTLATDPDYNPMADFDGNGEVNIADFSLFSGNYNRVSPIVVP